MPQGRRQFHTLSISGEHDLESIQDVLLTVGVSNHWVDSILYRDPENRTHFRLLNYLEPEQVERILGDSDVCYEGSGPEGAKKHGSYE